MHRGRQRNVGTGHFGDAGAPHATCDDNVLGLDTALVGDHRRNLAVRGFHRHDFGVGEYLEGVRRLRFFSQQCARSERVNGRYRRSVKAAEQDLFVDEGYEFFDFCWRDQLRRDAPCLRRCHTAIELLHTLRRTRHFDAAALGIDAEFHILSLAIERQQRHFFVVIRRENEV